MGIPKRQIPVRRLTVTTPWGVFSRTTRKPYVFAVAEKAGPIPAAPLIADARRAQRLRGFDPDAPKTADEIRNFAEIEARGWERTTWHETYKTARLALRRAAGRGAKLPAARNFQVDIFMVEVAK